MAGRRRDCWISRSRVLLAHLPRCAGVWDKVAPDGWTRRAPHTQCEAVEQEMSAGVVSYGEHGTHNGGGCQNQQNDAECSAFVAIVDPVASIEVTLDGGKAERVSVVVDGCQSKPRRRLQGQGLTRGGKKAVKAPSGVHQNNSRNGSRAGCIKWFARESRERSR